MLSRIAQLVLAATALGPIAVVHAASTFHRSPGEAVAWGGAAIGLTVLCLLLLTVFRRAEVERVDVVSVKSADREVLAFLLAYALPLLTPSGGQSSPLAVVVFVGLVLLVVYNAHLVHVNPLLALFGYHFYEVGTADGATYTMITRRVDHLPKGLLRVRRITRHAWLEVA